MQSGNRLKEVWPSGMWKISHQTRSTVAGLRHAADVDGRPAVLLDQLAAGLQDGLFGSDDRVHVFTPLF